MKGIPFIILNRLIILLIATGAFALNLFVQGFCQPVFYAKIWLILFFVSWNVFPFIKKYRIYLACLFFCGSGLPICTYILYFLIYKNDSLVAMLLFPLSSVIYLGVVFLLTLLIIIPFRLKKREERYFFFSGVIIPFIIQFVFILELRSSFDKISEAGIKSEASDGMISAGGTGVRPDPLIVKELLKVTPKNYYMERYLGRHWKYHTSLCLYDGWRPPLHDPLMNVAVHFTDPPPVISSWPVCQELYKQLFPDKPLKENCSCAPFSGDANTYLR